MSSSPVQKRKKPSLKKNTKTPESTQNPSLHDDLLLSCFARASRLYYPTLSLVSKSCASLLASPELYKTRSTLGRTESCLYVCLSLSFGKETNHRWFTLCRKPDPTLTTNDTMPLKKKRKKPSGYVLAKLSTPYSRSALWSGLVTVGSDIYNIGGPVGEANEPSSSVSILDCRSNTWREGPSMLVKRNFPHANVIDGKIYVTSGDSNSTSPDPMEVFDPKTQTWELVSTPPAETRLPYSNTISTSAGIHGKVYIIGSCNGLAYDTREGRWESVGEEMSWDWVWYSYCVVENVIYVYNNEEFKWYDSTVRLWKVLKGLKGLPKFPRYTARLADYGGKMAVLWGRVVASTGYVDKMIWCAVIALERRSDQEIWGKVEWSDAVLKVPKSCRIEHALAATL